MNNKEEKLTLLEELKVLLVLAVVFLLPGSLVGFILTKTTSINFIFGLIGTIIIEVILVFAFGLHKPAYTNENTKDDDEDDEE